MRRGGFAIGLALLLLGITAPPAFAPFHLMSVREVYPGSLLNPGSEFVELQMYSSGQNLVVGHPVRLYSATGAETAEATFLLDAPNGDDQASILVGTPAAAAQFGVTPDLTITPGLSPAGGAACFEDIDCVSWGLFTGTLPSPARSRTPAAAIPDGRALCRSIAAGDPGKLEASDDTDNSAADFAPANPSPRNNAAPAAGEPCPGAGSPYDADTDPPQTKIKKGPKGKVKDDTVKFRFRSDERGSTFKCKTLGKPFRRCRSPKKLKNLDNGKQRFKVFAIDESGNRDPTPAKRRFRVVGG